MYIKEIIKNTAKYKKKSYTDIAKSLGIKPQTYGNMLSRGNLTAATIEKIADCLECDIVFVDLKTGNAFFSETQAARRYPKPRKDHDESPQGVKGE